MSNSKILTSEERLSTHEALLAEDHDPANVFASWVTRDDLAALCATVRALRAENERLKLRTAQMERDARDDAEAASNEARWQERQGEDYGSY